jgi:hypothetical protein
VNWARGPIGREGYFANDVELRVGWGVAHRSLAGIKRVATCKGLPLVESVEWIKFWL